MAININKETVAAAIKNYRPQFTAKFKAQADIRDREIKNLLKDIATGEKEENILAVMNTAITDNGKKGFVLTADRLYFSKQYKIIDGRGKANFVELSNIKKAVAKKSSYWEYFGFELTDGNLVKIDGSIYCDDLRRFFTSLINASERAEKPEEIKPAEVKTTEVKPTETKPAEVKPAETKPTEAKPAEAKKESTYTGELTKEQRDYVNNYHAQILAQLEADRKKAQEEYTAEMAKKAAPAPEKSLQRVHPYPLPPQSLRK